MSNYEPVIADLQAEIKQKEEEIIGIKKTVNLLCKRAGFPAVYAEADLQISGTDLTSIKPDTFYAQPLNTSIRRILEMRKASGAGPAEVAEIYDALQRGGYQFGASTRENAIRGLRITLGKSSRDFHKLPNGSFGLIEWYPEIKDRKGKDGPESGSGSEAATNGASNDGDEQ